MYLIWVNVEKQLIVEGLNIDIPGDDWQLSSHTREVKTHEEELAFWSNYKTPKQ